MRPFAFFAMFLALFSTALSAQSPPDGAQKARDLKYQHEASGPEPPAAVKVPRGFALVVGISQYQTLPPEAQLSFPNRDAEEIYTTLISEEGGRFPAENVHKLIGAQATLANLRKELEQWLPSVTSDDDRVLIYFAGHGFVSAGKAYLAPYDISRADIPGTSYSMESLGKVFGSKIRGKWKVLLTDACHSGAITPEADREQLSRTLLDLNRSLFSLTASRDREQSFESAKFGGGHGVFTYYVVKGLEGEADVSGDGVVTADELAEYVHGNVRQATGGLQNPTSERGSFDPRMILAYNPGRTHVASQTASQFGTVIFESNMDGVEVFLDGKSQGVVNKSTPLRLPGIAPGQHTVQGVHLGYEPDGPRREVIYPGQDTTIGIKILVARRKNRAATDAFDKGLDAYNKGTKENYEKAAMEFQKAFDLDPQYSRAAMFLGRTYHLLFDLDKGGGYFQKAIAIDPDYTEAHASYGALLLDRGDYDAAVRQLNAAVQREPANASAWYLLSVALGRKEAYDQAIHAAQQAIKLTPRNGEAHFWLAESLRMTKSWNDAEAEYRQYLNYSDFESGLGGKLNYYVVGSLIGMGRKKRAAQVDIWKEMHNEAYFGICECESHLKRFDPAIASCQQALNFDPRDPFAHYQLARTFSEKYNLTGTLGLLAAARKHFSSVVELNPDTSEAAKSRTYIQNIDTVLAKQR